MGTDDGIDGGGAGFAALRDQARVVYGPAAGDYQLGRLEYPDAVYETLRERCGLGPGKHVLEIGPGTGQVTRHLLGAGARVVAVEPDPGFAAYLAEAFVGLRVAPSAFEDADLADAGSDLVVAGTSFHWLDQSRALEIIGRILRPGGWFAMWWTIFSDPTRPDPVITAATELLGFEPGNQRGGTSFQLDERARIHDLESHRGLVDVHAQRIQWNLPMNAARTRALFATQMSIRRLPPPESAHTLDTIARLIDDRFEGTDDRPLLTVLYSGRKPN